MSKLNFSRSCVHLHRQLIDFRNRPYLPAIYAARTRNLVLRCSRQTEKSTFLANTVLYECCTKPGIQILFVCPRREQAQLFSRERLIQPLENSPLIRRSLLGKRYRRPAVMDIAFKNGSAVHVRAAYLSGDSCRGNQRGPSTCGRIPGYRRGRPPRPPGDPEPRARRPYDSDGNPQVRRQSPGCSLSTIHG